MSISYIWGSFGFCVQSVVKACDCSSSEVNSSSDSGLLQSPPPICPVPCSTSHPLTYRNVWLHSNSCNDGPGSKVNKWLSRDCPQISE